MELILDGLDDLYDWAYLISADSDQAATARVFSERFPQKHLVIAAPPTKLVPDKARPYIKAGFVLTKEQIEAAVMGPFIRSKSGPFIRRPVAYDPPDWWVHPKDRPRR